ncbi:MAG: hypothetical protein PHD58_01480 [Anaerolineales bacterium]|nr:hypothetical protein [Anaerolineales bacterium]
MKYIISLLLTLTLLLASSGLAIAGLAPSRVAHAYSGIPTFSIVSVTTNKTVTIRTHNFPASDTFKVLMGKMGTKGVGGYYVDTISSGAGGKFTATFSIPVELKGQYQIAIRLQSTTGSGYYAYNWFYNKVGKGVSYSTKGYTGYPTFSISSVVRNKKVTIRTNNLPKNDTFKVLMNTMGTKGINGIQVGTFNSGTGGVKTFTFKIPADLKNLGRIAIRFQSTSGSGYYAYNWFYNNTYP